MINKKEISKIAQKILRHQKGLSDYQIMHPTREWVVGVSIAVLIFITSAYWSASTYLVNKNAPIEESVTNDSEVVLYRESLVSAALVQLEAKANRLVNLLNQTPALEPEEEVVAEEAVTTPTDTIKPEQDSFEALSEPVL